MALMVRLSEERERALDRMASTLQLSRNAAVSQAIDVAAPRSSHPDFVGDSVQRQLARYHDLMERLSRA